MGSALIQDMLLAALCDSEMSVNDNDVNGPGGAVKEGQKNAVHSLTTRQYSMLSSLDDELY